MDFDGRRVTVMGLGSFGGGVGAVRFLAGRGALVTITDLRTEAQLAESLATIDGLPNVELHLGGHVEGDFRNADLIVVNPAVPADSPFLHAAREAGVPLTTEMNLFWQHNRGKVVAVTGSNGKSTTTALIHSVLRAAGHRCWLGGNIGKSLLPVVDEIQPGDWVVLELSSFQLDELDLLRVSPHVAVVTNFTANHLDRHRTLEAYRAAKQTILRWQTAADFAVLNADDPDVAAWTTNGRRLLFGMGDHGGDGVFVVERDDTLLPSPSGRGAGGEGLNLISPLGALIRIDGRETEIPLGEWLKLPGRHNVQNALAAICAAAAIGVNADAVRRGLEEYEPLPHRLQLVGEVDGRRFYNDSLATTPESAVVALEAFSEPIVLLAGGYDKQVDLTEFARAIAARTKAVALMGQTAGTLAALIDAETQSSSQWVAGRKALRRPDSACSSPRRQVFDSFTDAFQWAVDQSQPGDVVLLSPGCASYDWFRNFVERGEMFTQLVGSAATGRHCTEERFSPDVAQAPRSSPKTSSRG